MPQIIEDALTAKIAEWIDANRPDELPEDLPVLVANRDERRTRPCIVAATSEAKVVPAMPHTARIKLDLHLFSQVDDTPVATHAGWAAAVNSHRISERAYAQPTFGLIEFDWASDSPSLVLQARGLDGEAAFEVKVARETLRAGGGVPAE
jgi:hypothetical protein